MIMNLKKTSLWMNQMTNLKKAKMRNLKSRQKKKNSSKSLTRISNKNQINSKTRISRTKTTSRIRAIIKRSIKETNLLQITSSETINKKESFKIKTSQVSTIISSIKETSSIITRISRNKNKIKIFTFFELIFNFLCKCLLPFLSTG